MSSAPRATRVSPGETAIAYGFSNAASPNGIRNGVLWRTKGGDRKTTANAASVVPASRPDVRASGVASTRRP